MQFSSIFQVLQFRDRVDMGAMAVRIPQTSSSTGTLLSDCLVSYPGHTLVGVTPRQRCSRRILQYTEIMLKQFYFR